MSNSYIEQFKQRDGWYITADGIHHETSEDILCHLLDFCGCGDPESALAFTAKGLNHINRLRETWEPEWKPESNYSYDQWKADGIKLFGSDGAAYFFYYWAAKHKLTEHGGSVPGWLTDYGKQILHDLCPAK